MILHEAAPLTESLFLKPLLLEFHKSTTKCKVPIPHCARFAEYVFSASELIIIREVIIPLCTTAQDPDVKTIALFSLVLYKTQGEVATKGADLLYQLMADEKDNLFNSKKPNDQVLN